MAITNITKDTKCENIIPDHTSLYIKNCVTGDSEEFKSLASIIPENELSNTPYCSVVDRMLQATSNPYLIQKMLDPLPQLLAKDDPKKWQYILFVFSKWYRQCLTNVPRDQAVMLTADIFCREITVRMEADDILLDLYDHLENKEEAKRAGGIWMALHRERNPTSPSSPHSIDTPDLSKYLADLTLPPSSQLPPSPRVSTTAALAPPPSSTTSIPTSLSSTATSTPLISSAVASTPTSTSMINRILSQPPQLPVVKDTPLVGTCLEMTHDDTRRLITPYKVGPTWAPFFVPLHCMEEPDTNTGRLVIVLDPFKQMQIGLTPYEQSAFCVFEWFELTNRCFKACEDQATKGILRSDLIKVGEWLTGKHTTLIDGLKNQGGSQLERDPTIRRLKKLQILFLIGQDVELTWLGGSFKGLIVSVYFCASMTERRTDFDPEKLCVHVEGIDTGSEAFSLHLNVYSVGSSLKIKKLPTKAWQEVYAV